MPWLEWHNRNDDLKATAKTPYHLLQPIQSLSHGDEDAPNMLIQGENLEALKALLPYYAGQVKCIFIDPPYNTKSAFELYDDNLEHAKWLSMMYPRLELLRELLAEDGSIYATIDFNEAHYLKVLMDEVFGRKNFQREIIWRIGWLSGYKTMAKNYIRNHDTILYYSKNAEKTYFQKEYIERKDFAERFSDAAYKALLSRLTDLGVSKKEASEFMDAAQVEGLPERYPLEDTWNSSIYDKLNSIAVVSFSGESVSKMLGVEELKGQKSEALIRRILRSSTRPGDLVLDSFAGTGTTGAVAHKMKRRWIMIERGDHATTHVAPRLKLVIDGQEQSGITKAEDWQGGGGFRFYRLGPKVFDDNGRINPEIKFEHLAAHIWFAETGTARSTRAMKSPLLGVHNGTAYYLLYNGILGDKTLAGGNMLTMKVLAGLPKHDGPMVIYGEGTNMTNDRLRSLGIKFKKTPNDIRAR
ncbi:site-specific DNA-methyltransferase [Pseudoxanthomonas koreensis]|uniref:site-specific DNA-methyltransferase n=1 Tax=Pseudoxanthomonas koreensis TaxID=266061 RepID=UPI0013920169|nr:site-specific DNA-methyltransferase [Pseudoxanthomonas koreensis]KAF1689565.1 site-specific DNA-methyltransferase [Pseudoxanthomonas koreensis]